jgi:phosphoribosylformylglycinamidine cyclo-ligase
VANGNNDAAYSRSGVSIESGRDAVRLMKSSVESTWNGSVIGGYGAFAGLYRIGDVSDKGDVLAVTIDGVGTKLKVAALCGIYDSVGMDIVYHCTNDLLPARARPVVFADYFGCSTLSPEVVSEAVRGMSEACVTVGCSLIAGETAEMPGVYCEGESDIVGCMMGLARESELASIPPVAPGDVLVGLESSGLHTNGYSLARNLLFEKADLKVDTHVPELGRTVGEELLKVHREYLTVLEPLLGDSCLHALAHITGGGLIDNVARILPDGCAAHVERDSWEPLPVFQYLKALGDLTDDEAYRVFNMGIGMVLVVETEHVDAVLGSLSGAGVTAHVIGAVRDGQQDVVVA